MSNPISLILRGIREVGLRATWDGFVHAIRTRWIAAKFGDPKRQLRGLPLLWTFLKRLQTPPGAFPPASPVVTQTGQLRSYARDGRSVVLTFANATLRLTVLAPDLIRARLRPTSPSKQQAAGSPLAYAIARPDDEWPLCAFDVAESPEAVEVRTEEVTCSVARAGGQVTFLDQEGNAVAGTTAPAGWTPDRQTVCRWSIPADAHFYALGQRTTEIDRRGNSYVNWNTDPRVYNRGDDPVNLCVPLLLALHSGGRQGYGLFVENTARSRFDLGRSDPDAFLLDVEDETLSLYFFYGPELAKVLGRYTKLTGRLPMFPLWALGYHQSRWSYYPEARVRRLAREFRRSHRVPCDAIHLDIHYMDGYRCFTWHPRRFPDPAGLMDDLHEQGFKVITIIDPGIKVDRAYRVFEEGLAEDVFCRYPDGQCFIGPVWPGNCAFPDFTDAEVRGWWGELHRDLVEAGVDGIWDDMNEPSLFGGSGATIPRPVRHKLDGRGCDHRQAHNIYGLVMARATSEGLSHLRSNRRPFVLTRSGWAGIQRYAAHWTGDNHSSWESLRLTLPMVLGLGLSGVAFTGADIGGFAGPSDGELFTRWLQLGIFLPFLRAHTAQGTPDQEPWSWGEPYLSINREFIHLRYRLLPYLYTALWQCAQTGMPIARPLFLAFQDDPATFALDDEFLCGDALLVAPALEEGETQRSVYLPQGIWYDFWTDARYEGPARIEADASLERIPLLVRAGSVVPMWPVMDYVGQQPVETLTLHVYPGRGVSWLYEDDGESVAYERGEYRLTHFVLSTSQDGLDLVREPEGEFDPGYDRLDIVVHGVGETPQAVEGMPSAETTYSPESRTLRLSGESFSKLSVSW
ncbi:MAG: glycoside hydrolase family 31 protein [Anaerolineae bacterium]|jgi:alpha-glucosidase